MRIIILGGNGFVGTHVAQALIQHKCQVSSISRSGVMPRHLAAESWADQVNWRQGDAGEIDNELFSDCDVLISTVGAPPLPTFTSAGYDRSFKTNGEVNAHAIAAAGEAGVKRIVLLGAKIPPPLRGDWFAYARGKRIAATAAEQFSEISDEHSAVVVQPGGIFGKRHTTSGAEIPIDLVLAPLAKLMPSQLISVERVARCIAESALGLRATSSSYSIIPHGKI